MSVPSTASASNSTSNPLQDDELSDITKQEIIYWSNKLKITPSQLFSLTSGELDILLQEYVNGEYGESNTEQPEQNEKNYELSQTNEKVIQKQQKGRLKGGAGNALREILSQAARDIENMYGSGECEQSYEYAYDSEESPYSYDACSDEAVGFEDISFNNEDSVPSTPQSQLPANNTYCIPNANATYNVRRPDATFTCPYDNWSPQQYTNISNSCDTSNNQSFRNYTDYSIKYGPTGTKEASSSISVENFDDSSGQVTASSRTFTLPPATSATSALLLSKISPPSLASRVLKRHGKGTPLCRQNNSSNVSPTQLASGCVRRSPRNNDLSNISPPILTSCCRGNISPSTTLRSDLSNITPPSLSSGYARQSSPPGFQLADISQPQLVSDCCATARSPKVAPANRCPHLSAALGEKTQMRVKPKGPCCPRRIC